MRLMKRRVLAIAATLACGVAGGFACDRRESSAEAEAVYVPVATQPATQSTGWTARQVEEDPDGYLRWWEQQIAKHVDPLRAELEEWEGKRRAWEGTWRVLAANVALAESTRDQVYRQYQLTQYTEPLPETISVAGRQVRRARVPELLRRLDSLVLEQQRLRDLAQATVRAVESRAAIRESQTQRFVRIADQVKLDVSVVKETKSAIAVNVDGLREELESAAATTSQDAGDDAALIPTTLPTTRPAAPFTFDELLG